jgi:hypothetical protein
MRRLVPCAVALGLIVCFAIRARAQDDPKEIIRQAIAAHGGAGKLNKFKGSKGSSKGTITIQTMEVEFTAESVGMLPDKQKTTLKMDVNGMAITLVQLINGDKTSVSVNGMAAPVPDSQKAELKQSSFRQKILALTPLLSDKGLEFKALGETKVGDKDVVGVQISGMGLKETKVYFDKSTHLIAKMEYMGPDPTGTGEVKQEMIVSDYKDVQGIMKPAKVSIMNDGKKFMEATINKQEVMERVDDKEFDE